MIEYLVSYWLIVLPTALTGIYLLAVLKRARDEKAARRAPAGVTIER